MSYTPIISFSLKKLKKYYLAYRRLWNLSYKLPRTTKKSLWKPVQQSLRLTDITSTASRFFNAGEYIVVFYAVHSSLAGNVIYSPLFFFNNNSNQYMSVCNFSQYTVNFFRTVRSGFLAKQYVTYPVHISPTFVNTKTYGGSIISSNNYLLFMYKSDFLGTSLYYDRWLREICRVIFYFILLKIKYKGKSYKWFRKNKTLILRFGYSHIVFIRIPNFFFNRKRGKMKLVFFGTCSWSLKAFLSSTVSWRPMNVYTGRGLRFAKQLVFRKFGKVSAYR